MWGNMKVVIKDENGKRQEFDVKVVDIIGKDDDHYRLTQDFERGIEVTADGLSSKIYIEPRCSNQITIINKERA